MLIGEIRHLEGQVGQARQTRIRREVGIPSLDGAPEPLLVRYCEALRLVARPDPADARNRDLEDYVRAHNATRSGSKYTIWVGKGRGRRLVGSTSDQDQARALAHEHAPAQLWVIDGDEPALITSRRRTRELRDDDGKVIRPAEVYAVEVRGPWALDRLQADLHAIRRAKHGARSPIPELRRARRAANALRRGCFSMGGRWFSVKAEDVSVTQAGLIRRGDR
jgi:hypothetical protein